MEPFRVLTAQNVDLAFTAAGVGERLKAWVVDVVLAAAYWILIMSFGAGGNSIAWQVVLWLPLLLYHLLFEVFFEGRTPGKMAVGLRVARLDGAQPTLGQYLLRWMLRFVDVTLTSGLVAVVAIASTKHGQRLGDLAAGTTVVKRARRIDLDDVRYPVVGPGFEPVFPEAAAFSDADVRTLRAVLVRLKLDPRSSANRRLLARAQAAAEARLGLPPAEREAEAFLEALVRDHTAVHDRLTG